MKRLVMTFALTCLFSVSALAGDVSTSGFTSPAPPGSTETTSATSSGETPSVPGDVSTSGFTEQVSDAALSALLSVLGLLTV